jgi:cytochrome c oxidase subunit 2
VIAYKPLGDAVGAIGEVFRYLLNLPEQASSAAAGVDALQYVEFTFFWAIGLVLITFTAWCVVRFPRRPGDETRPTPRVKAPHWLEALFVTVLLGAFIGFWAVGFQQYVKASIAPRDAIEVYVTGKQWMWKFAYPQGASSAGILYVPEHKPVRLVLTSRDVIHSLFVPAFRLKQDAVPGRFTSTWFEAAHPGRYDILCAEFCGTGHSRMWGEVVVLSAAGFETWLSGQAPTASSRTVTDTPLLAPGGGRPLPDGSLAARGLSIAAEQGCFRCHTSDGTPHIGPTWRGLFGSTVVLEDGTTLSADAAYLTESMMDPMAKIVRGYRPVMPTYQGRVDPGQVAAILEYIRALSQPGPAPGETPPELPAASLEAYRRALPLSPRP